MTIFDHFVQLQPTLIIVDWHCFRNNREISRSLLRPYPSLALIPKQINAVIVHYASLTCNSTQPQHTLQSTYKQWMQLEQSLCSLSQQSSTISPILFLLFPIIHPPQLTFASAQSLKHRIQDFLSNKNKRNKLMREARFVVYLMRLYQMIYVHYNDVHLHFVSGISIKQWE